MMQFLQSLGIAEPLGLGAISVILTFLAAWGFTHQFMPRVRQFAIKVGWADMPNERRLNKIPLPNAGGLAIFAGFIGSVVVAWALRPIVIEGVQIQVLAILLGGALLVITGFIDDQFGLPPIFRLVVQLIAALLLVVNGMHIDLASSGVLPASLQPFAHIFSIAITLFWVIGITNAINLMDGVDGVAGGIGFVASMVLLAVSAQFAERASATILLAGLAGAILGFLRHNFNPSRIIMGDTGAYLIGYTLAAVSLLGTLKISAGVSLLLPLLVLALPILDTTQVVIGRLRRGVNPLSHPDKTHLHHRILAKTNARSTAIIIWSLSLLFSIVGMALQKISPLVIVVTALGIAALLAWVVFRRVISVDKDRELDLQATQEQQGE